jgi:hypothetical protein
MASSLNELLVTYALPSDSQEQLLSDGRLVDKSEVSRFLQ